MSKSNESRRKTLTVFWLILLACLASCSNSNTNTETPSIPSIRVVMDNNYPPYAFLDTNGNMQGVAVDQWKLWGEKTGVKVDIIGMPWGEALEGMKRGEFDVIDTIFYTEERAKLFDFTKPYAEINVNIFFQNNISGIAEVGDLKGFRVAVKSGDANAEYLTKQGITSLVYYDSYEDIIKAASKKEETIFVIDQPPALYYLYKFGIQDDFNYSRPLYGGEFHRAVKKGNTELLNLVNDGFARISEQEYENINEHWFGIQQAAALTHILPTLQGAALITLAVFAVLIIFNRALGIQVRTRTKELEDALLKLGISESQFRDSIEFLPIPISIADLQGNLVTVNRKFTEHYGYTVEDIPTISTWTERAYPDPAYREQVLAQWNEDVGYAIREKMTTPLREYRITDKYGKLHDIEIIMHPTGKLWVASFLDITERKQAEESLRATTARLETLFRVSPLGIFMVDANDIVQVWNPSAEKIFGWTSAEVLGNPNPIIPADRRDEYEKIKKSINDGTPIINYETTRINKHGETIDVSISSTAIFDDSGKAIGRMAIFADIRERKLAEKQLHESEARYRTLFEDSPISLLEEDFSEAKKYVDELRRKGVADFRRYFAEHPDEIQHCASLVQIVDMNKTVLNWYGIQSKSEFHKRLDRALHPNEYQSFVEEILALINGKSSYEISISRIARDGKFLHLIINGTIVPGHEDTWDRVLVSISDITERKRAEDSLKASEEKFEKAFKASPDGIYLAELENGKLVEVNDGFEKLYGYTRQEALNKTSLELGLFAARADYEAFTAELRTHGRVKEKEFNIRAKDGEQKNILVSAELIDIHNTVHIVVVNHNITERKKFEDRILNLNRLYITISQINQTIIHQRDKLTLLREICRVAVEHGQFSMAWIGLINPPDTKVDPVVFAGAEKGYLKEIQIDFEDDVLGRGPTGTAVRERRCIICQDIATDPRMEPWRNLALERGYRSSAAVPIHERGKVAGALTVYSSEPNFFDKDDMNLLDEIGLDISFALDTINAEAERTRAEEALLRESALNAKMAMELQAAYDSTLEGWSLVLDLRDRETEGHTRRVTEMAVRLAQAMGLGGEEIKQMRRGSLLHDIGKLGVPDSILHKPGKLTDEEWVIMSKHPTYAFEMISRIEYLKPALEIPYCHHEKWNGSGYPQGLKGEEIPLAARIFAVVDVWDALSFDRPYRAAWDREKVIQYIKDESGKHFDPHVTAIFLNLLARGEI